MGRTGRIWLEGPGRTDPPRRRSMMALALSATLLSGSLFLTTAPSLAGLAIIDGQREAPDGEAETAQPKPGPSTADLWRERQTGALEGLSTLEAELKALPAITADAAPAGGGRRLALVIGNNGYEELPALAKAVGDARSVSTTLSSLGFQVSTAEDVTIDGFDEALEAFYGKLQAGDVVVFYFAGHGVAYENTNYLLPVDSPMIGSDEGRRLRRAAIDAGEILTELRNRGVELALVVLDACRDDPFQRGDTRAAVRIGGLAPLPSQRDNGMFVIYSAGVGEQALDRLGPGDTEPNSVFTRKFVPILTTPGLPLVDIAKRTQVEVRALAQKVRHRQAPAYYDQVIGQYYFQPPRPRLFALAIGIDKYAGTTLAGAVNDANAVADAMTRLGAEKVVRMLDEDARPNFIGYVWKDLLEGAKPGDTIVLSFAGSSAQKPAPESSGEQDGKDEFLLLAGVDMEAAKRGAALDPATVLTDDQLTAWMEQAAEKNVNVVLLIDGCHGGGLLDREFANVSFIGASAEDQVVGEYHIDGRMRGLASVAFVGAVEGKADHNGDGFVTQRELFHYVSRSVIRDAKWPQTPEFLPSLRMPGTDTPLDIQATASYSAGDLPLFKLSPAESSSLGTGSR